MNKILIITDDAVFNNLLAKVKDSREETWLVSTVLEAIQAIRESEFSLISIDSDNESQKMGTLQIISLRSQEKHLVIIPSKRETDVKKVFEKSKGIDFVEAEENFKYLQEIGVN